MVKISIGSDSLINLNHVNHYQNNFKIEVEINQVEKTNEIWI